MKAHGPVSGTYKHSINVSFIGLIVYGELKLFIVKSITEMPRAY